MAVISVREPRSDTAESLNDALAKLRDLAQVTRIVCAAPVQTISGWSFDSFHADDLATASRLRRLLSSCVARADGAFEWFDPQTPQPQQRNALVDLRRQIPDAEFQASRLYCEVLRPLQLQQYSLARALLCDGESLLAWFAVFHSEPFTARQCELLAASLPALQHRFRRQRRLEDRSLIDSALDAVPGLLLAPALVVTPSSRLIAVNEAGRAILATRRAEASRSIAAALAHEPAEVDLVALDAHGAADHWLAVMRKMEA